MHAAASEGQLGRMEIAGRQVASIMTRTLAEWQTEIHYHYPIQSPDVVQYENLHCGYDHYSIIFILHQPSHHSSDSAPNHRQLQGCPTIELRQSNSVGRSQMKEK